MAKQKKPKSVTDQIEELTKSLKKPEITPDTPALWQEGVKTGGEAPKAIVTANSEKTQKIDGRKTNPQLFKPGQSGNPKGPKPGYKHFKPIIMKVIQEALKTQEGGKMQAGEAMVRAVIKRVIASGDVQAFNSITDRIDGRPPQPLIGDAEEDAIRVDLTTGMRSILGKAYGDNNGGQ